MSDYTDLDCLNYSPPQLPDAGIEKLLALWAWQADIRRGRPGTTEQTYAAAALRQELASLETAAIGERNNRLNAAAFNVGTLVGAGSLSRTEAEDALHAKGIAIGLGEEEVKKTVRSGLNGGQAKPRDLSRLNGHTAPSQHAQPELASPAPQQAPAQPETWEQPIPLNAPPPVEAFPLDVFPSAIRNYVEKVAWATNTPPDFAAVPLLVCAAGAIGNSRQLAVTRTHRQPSCLFAAVIGRPGSGKSTPLDIIKEPLEQAEQWYYDQWKREMETWKALDSETRGAKPALRRALIDDTTVEAMVRVLTDNPRGLCMPRDELAALVTGMNQYKDGGKGSDRQAWLKVWSGATIKVDRKTQEGVPLIVRRPLICIVGGVQPQVIEWLRGEQQGERPPPDDGFLDRFLLSYPDPLPATGETWRDVSPDEAAVWSACAGRLLALEMLEKDGDRFPQLLPLDAGGKDAWSRLTQEHANEVNASTFPEWLWGPWAKLVPGYAGRLALILQLLWDDGGAVGGSCVERAFSLVRYFKGHARKVYAVMGADPRVQEAQHVLVWLSRNPQTEVFSRSDAYVDLRRSFKTPEALDRPLKLLVEHRYLYPLEPPARPGSGRRPTPRYKVNPLGRQEIQTIQTMQSGG